MMSAMPPVRSEVIVPSSLHGLERERLIDALHAVHSQIFDGVDRDAFVHYVVASAGESTT